MAGIPNLLWGNYLLTVYGVPTIVDEAAFVTPDDLTQVAFSSLKSAGFLPCNSLGCPHLDANRVPPAFKHLHINDEVAVSLYRKSDVLWEFDLENNPDIMIASDDRLLSASLGRGRGRFLSCPCTVKIPSAVKYCEALILLLCRDYDSSYETYWLAILSYILEYVNGTDILDENKLQEGYRKFYHALKLEDPEIYSILDELRFALIEERRLPVINY
ncbi:hypothetical protein DTO027I6_9111 [Penicillium roqueforti]|uniref:uncharacterized protein n=1 Tax=Penicillium roqueforti TaxID=5082 RepID=UPI00190CA8BE|nr:uncharacterized protein LCP9604111_4077 [Penicillium roqueforti]KAF9249977.1 hypothetical protein LCP9604111_4077 [Penicillium roqueforti]KAI2681176.1 hypothetical protein LCP963914a_6686 [Penicillium roqueforti]KAI2715507.1 hypothetical protein CBS147318_6107 [Penicillium roqueforti]KAI2731802.1 hypothetical protein DTO013F2_10605 [Penicillium roqueforti]KAI3124066.1 hypothetical protein CBS147330_7131 [Penicillium roqueforti]